MTSTRYACNVKLTEIPFRFESYYSVTIGKQPFGSGQSMSEQELLEQGGFVRLAERNGYFIARRVSEPEWEEFIHRMLMQTPPEFKNPAKRIPLDEAGFHISIIHANGHNGESWTVSCGGNSQPGVDKALRYDQRYFKGMALRRNRGVPVSVSARRWRRFIDRMRREYENSEHWNDLCRIPLRPDASANPPFTPVDMSSSESLEPGDEVVLARDPLIYAGTIREILDDSTVGVERGYGNYWVYRKNQLLP